MATKGTSQTTFYRWAYRFLAKTYGNHEVR